MCLKISKHVEPSFYEDSQNILYNIWSYNFKKQGPYHLSYLM